MDYMLINLHCLDSQEEIHQKIFKTPLPKTVVDNDMTPVTLLDEKAAENLDDELKVRPSNRQTTPKVNGLLVLKQINPNSLRWQQEWMEGIYPNFFIDRGSKVSDRFTYDTGELIQDHQKGFKLLQTVIREGNGEDLNGIRWKLKSIY